MSGKPSYASMTSKNVASTNPPPSEMNPDELGSKKSNAPLRPTGPNHKTVNGNASSGLKTTKEDFPPIESQQLGNFWLSFLG